MVERASPRAGAPRRPLAVHALRLALLGVALLSLVGAYIGIRQHLATQPGSSTRAIDMWYYALQLFVLEAPPPLADAGPYPPLLEVTRFTAPVVTIYALVETARVLIAAGMRRRRTRRAHGHLIVCGDGPLAACLTRRLVEDGQRVVAISPGRPDGGDLAAGPLRVYGDARDPGVLREAGIANAVALYACTADSAANTAIALAAADRSTARRPSAVYAHVADADLCLALQARHLGAGDAAGFRLDFFNVDELAARRLCEANPLRPPPGRAPRVLVLGATAFALAVIVELARQWWVQAASDTLRLQLALVDEHATAVLDRIVHRYPFLLKACHLVGYDGDVSTVADERLRLPPDRVFICYEDEQRALKVALTTAWLWRGGPGSVVVRQNQLAAVRDAISAGRPGPAGRRLFDEVSGTLLLFGVVDAGCEPRLIRDDLGERLARVIHERYLVARRQRVETVPVTPSLVPWQALAGWLKAENRALAADIGHKLRLLGCVLAPRVDDGAEHHLSAAEVELIAAAEHRRWVAERRHAGWSYGEERDDARKQHPALCPWAELPERLRERNRDAMRQLPAILADCGFRIVQN